MVYVLSATELSGSPKNFPRVCLTQHSIPSTIYYQMTSKAQIRRPRSYASEPYNLTQRDAARFLKLSLSTIGRYVREGKMPHVRLNNRTVRFRMSELVEFAERSKSKVA